MSLLLRFFIGIVGVGIVGAAAHSNIIATGGYGQPTAIVTIALAAGVAIGAIAIGLATSGGRWVLSVIIFVALLCGEAYNLLNSAEQVITSRDAAQAPLRDAAKKHNQAVRAVEEAKARVEMTNAVRSETARVTAAKVALDAANKAVMEQASAKNCLKNCASMLTAAATAARQELSDALAAADAQVASDRQKANAELENAERALAAAPMPGSATPLADRLGIPAWLLDILMASLKSVGVNLLGAALIAVAAHGPKRRREERAALSALQSVTFDVPSRLVSPKPTKRELMPAAERPKSAASISQDANNVVALVPPPAPAGSVAKFLLDALEHHVEQKVEIIDFYTNYRSWCSAKKLTALKVEAFNEELAEALDIAGIETRKIRGRIYLIDVAFRDHLSVAI